jgi:hypothetical protein
MSRTLLSERALQELKNGDGCRSRPQATFPTSGASLELHWATCATIFDPRCPVNRWLQLCQVLGDKSKRRDSHLFHRTS